MAHAAIGRQPDELELATYAALVRSASDVTARQRHPDIATHLSACFVCRNALDEAVSALQSFRSPVVDVSHAALPDAGSIVPAARLWQVTDTLVRRFVAPFILSVRPFAVRITNAFAPDLISAGGAGSAAVLMRGKMRGKSQVIEQSYALDLGDDASTPHARVRARINLRALATGRLSGQIRLIWLPDGAPPGATSTAGEVTDSIPWHIDREVGDQVRLVVSGMTASDGLGYFSLKADGDYLLTFEVDGFTWQIPFSLQTELDPHS
jgi:hypothetical protein